MIEINDEKSIEMVVAFDAIKSALQEKASLLSTHEDKPYAFVGLPYSNCSKTTINGKEVCTVSTNLFRDITYYETLAIANQTFKGGFGIRNPLTVIEAIYKVVNNVKVASQEQITEFAKLLSQENFCFVAEVKDGKVVGDMLRVDLFRDVKNTEFIGGLFHAYKHFSYRGVPLSTHSNAYEIPHPRYLRRVVIESFFNLKEPWEKKDNYETVFPLNANKSIRVGYYQESKALDVYFVNTAFPFNI